jgi:hypothetical protein
MQISIVLVLREFPTPDDQAKIAIADSIPAL